MLIKPVARQDVNSKDTESLTNSLDKRVTVGANWNK